MQADGFCSRMLFEHINSSNKVHLALQVSVIFGFNDKITDGMVRLDDMRKEQSATFRRFLEDRLDYMRYECFPWTWQGCGTDGLKYHDESSVYLFLNYRAELDRENPIHDDFFDECASRGELLFWLKNVAEGYAYSAQSPNLAAEFWRMIEPYSQTTLESIIYRFLIIPSIS